MTSRANGSLSAPDRITASSLRPPVPILIVDDNPSKRVALKSVLVPLGYAIVEADSGLEALRAVMAQDFAMILLDVHMPDMDGFETAALIRLRRQSEMTPIIFITAYGRDEVLAIDRYAEGAVDFIFAPVPPEELRAKVSFFANLFVKAELLAARARDVQRSADQLELLTEAAPIGIFQTDSTDRYVYTNPRWSEITGIAPEDAAGRTWQSVLSAAHLVAPVAEGAEPAPERDELCHRYAIRAADGGTRIVLVTSKAVPDGQGGTVGQVGTLADVTAEAGAEAAMSDARDTANEASRLKSDFLANMSHEIRTPMNGVIGMTDLLLETDLDARQRDYAQTVRNSGEALLTIINDILDFSKIEAGKVEIEAIEFDLRAILYGVVDLLARPAQTKGLELVVSVDTSLPTVVIGDPGRVRQALTNLIGNAIKFTQSGEIVVRVGSDGGPGDGTLVRFDVTDSGDGIPEDKLAKMFEPFVQADTSTSRKYEGTGLGLAITGQLVSLMGGQCGATSTEGIGSTFWFTILVGVEHDEQSSGVNTGADAELGGVSALIVDDSAAQRQVLSDYLTGWGMEVTTADCGQAALATMRTAAIHGRSFAVALLDLSMPGMDGLDLKSAIALDPSLDPRLILMTSLGGSWELGAPEGSGVDASITKPVHPEDLRIGLRTALGLHTPEVVGPDACAGASMELGTPMVGRLLLAEDNIINQKVAVAMLSSAGYEVDTVTNGALAVLASAAHRYDAILMDCQMPDLNGYEATAAIRAREGTSRHTPIIAMTAGARREDRERCLAEGMDAYLAKPVSKDALLAMVARSLRQAPVAGAATSSVITRPVPVERTLDPTVIDELRTLGSDDALIGALVDQFVDESATLLVQLRAAVDAGDAHTVGSIAHSIKGSAHQLGGHRFALACGRLENVTTSGGLADASSALTEVEAEYEALCRELRQQVGALQAAGPDPIHDI